MSKRLMAGQYWFLAFEFALGAVTKYWPGDTIFSSAPTHLVIMVILVLANWPGDWRNLLWAPDDEERIAALVKQAAS